MIKRVIKNHSFFVVCIKKRPIGPHLRFKPFMKEILMAVRLDSKRGYTQSIFFGRKILRCSNFQIKGGIDTLQL